MSHRPFQFGIILATSLVGAIFLAPRASAADLDPGYAGVPPSIPEQQVTFGSGWYVRGDIGATENYKLDIGIDPNTKTFSDRLRRSQNAGYDLTLGGGYAFTNSIRSDIIVDFHQPIESKYFNEPCVYAKTGGCSYDGKFNHYDAMVNGYYDFGPWSIVTPYVGAGVGVGFGNVRVNVSGDTIASAGSVSYRNFAWALMAGLAFDIYPHVKLDVGYRYLNGGTVEGTNIYDHELRAGVRYMIDN